MYADDSLLFSSGKNIYDLYHELNLSLGYLYIENKVLEKSESFKFLGVINYLISKLSISRGIFYKLNYLPKKYFIIFILFAGVPVHKLLY